MFVWRCTMASKIVWTRSVSGHTTRIVNSILVGRRRFITARCLSHNIRLVFRVESLAWIDGNKSWLTLEVASKVSDFWWLRWSRTCLLRRCRLGLLNWFKIYDTFTHANIFLQNLLRVHRPSYILFRNRSRFLRLLNLISWVVPSFKQGSFRHRLCNRLSHVNVLFVVFQAVRQVCLMVV